VIRSAGCQKKSLKDALLRAACSVACWSAMPAWAVDASAQTFVRNIYRTYEMSETPVDILSRAKAERYFTRSTAELIARDAAQKRGDVGQLNFDPFVNAQDWTPTKIDLAFQDGASPVLATATATYRFNGTEPPTAIRLDLMKTSAGWRVSDVHWTGTRESLRELLRGKH
jgi:hypothetical protein